MSHTKGPWKVRKSCHGNKYKLVAFSCKRDEVYTTLELEPDDAKFIVAACNSYDRHFGPRAVEAAEADVLGKALEALGMLWVSHSPESDHGIKARKLVREVLSMVKGGE